MKKINFSKLFSSLFIFTLIFSLLAPAFSASPKNENIESNDYNERLELMKEVIDDQVSLLEREPTIAPSLLKQRNADAEVDVIIQFSEAPIALKKGIKTIERKTFSAAEKNAVKNRILSQQDRFDQFTKTNEIAFEKGFTYDNVLNGMSGKVKASDLEKLLEVPGIVSIEPNSMRYALETPDAKDQKTDSEITPFMDQTVPHLGISELWDRGITGEDVKVAVLDTGIDYHHPDLVDVYKGGFNFVDHTDGTYAKDREDNDPYETYPSERPEGTPEIDGNGSSFYTTHGTHVAGTIAAQNNNDYEIQGIAPDIDLYAYRVLGAYGSGSMDGIIAGIEQSVLEDMDIINLSLGGGSNNEYSADTVAINNATLAGVTAVVATGNAGPSRGSIGNPSTAALAISVGNSTAPEELKQASVHVKAGDYLNESAMSLLAWTYGSDPKDDLDEEVQIVAIPEYGAPKDFEGINVEGKIALISRGDIAFVDKIDAAKEAGAIATLIHNNEGIEPSDVFLSTAFEFIPSFDMATEEGNDLRAALKENTGTVTFKDFETSETEGNEMSESSSQGPSTPNFDIKPDVVAPGSNIMSTVPAYQKDYEDADYGKAYDRASGTSMATPHVVAVAALIKSEHPDFDPFDIKVALSNTAKLLDTEKYDVFSQGAGLVQPVEAIDSEAYAYVADTAFVSESETDTGNLVAHQKGTITFGHVQPNPDRNIILTKEIEIKNTKPGSSDYEVSVDTTKAATGAFADATVTVDKDSFSLNGFETVTVSLNIPAGEEDIGNEILGYVHIANDKTDLSLPFAAEFAPAQKGVDYFELKDHAIATDSEGSPNSTEAAFKIFDEQNLLSLELYDAINLDDKDEIKYLGQYALENSLPAGAYSLEFDENYFDSRANDQQAPDGVYGISLFTLNSSFDEGNELEAPFFIKSTNPEIEFNSNDPDQRIETITGTIDDQFIDFKSPVEENLDIPYNANEHLTAIYEITKNEEFIKKEKITITEDGSFDISTKNLDSGDYTVTLSVEDRLGHTAEEEMNFTISEKINLSLAASTTDPTDGPVTIEATVDSETEVTDLQWLAGNKEIADFENDGEAIDMDSNSFEVSENGMYTVYVRNESGLEAVQIINIQNIKTKNETLTIDLNSSPEEPTEELVTIGVEVDSETDLQSLKWLQGEHDQDVFAENGEDIDTESMAFEVKENAIYSVFAENSSGLSEVQTITITNIINPGTSAFELTLEIENPEPTINPVTITVDSDSESDLTSLKWLPGVHHNPEAFAEEGNAIDLEANAFAVEDNGFYTVFAQNSEEETSIAYVEVTNIIEEPELFTIELSPSPTGDTEDPVTVHVTHTSKADIASAKWLEGEHSADAFAETGNIIDLGIMSFDVTENGVYSVFVENEQGVGAVELILIDNIKQPEPEPEPTPEPISVEFELSKEDPTVDPITVTVHANSEAEITEAKWLEGRKSLKEIKESGNAFKLDAMSFVTTKNGTYSVYVQNSDGTEVLHTITITNIIKENPEDPVSPGDPAEPKPSLPGDDEDKDKDNGEDNNGGTGNNGDNNGGKNNGNSNGGNNGKKVVNSGNGGKGSVGGNQLPKTATNTFNILLFGTILTIIGGLSLYAVHRRKQKKQ